MAKLSREKILQFIGLTHNVGKTFMALLNTNKSSFHVLKKNFRSLLKIFSLVSFIPYGSYTLLIYLTMLVVPLLHTTTSAYYVMPDNHYHPILMLYNTTSTIPTNISPLTLNYTSYQDNIILR